MTGAACWKAGVPILLTAAWIADPRLLDRSTPRLPSERQIRKIQNRWIVSRKLAEAYRSLILSIDRSCIEEEPCAIFDSSCRKHDRRAICDALAGDDNGGASFLKRPGCRRRFLLHEKTSHSSERHPVPLICQTTSAGIGTHKTICLFRVAGASSGRSLCPSG
jgi:hypothetical protein